MKEVYVKIKGRVQGIGFRWFAVREAKRIGGISGWVRNEADGSVEILMSGAEDKIDEMLLSCRKGPALSRSGQRRICRRPAQQFSAADRRGRFPPGIMTFVKKSPLRGFF